MKKIISLSLISLFLLVSSFVQQKPTTDSLPNMPIKTTSGVTTNANKLKGKNILVVFLPDCDHCQREATEIKKKIANFKGYNLYFLSNAKKEDLIKFAKDYKLSGISNVHFGETTSDAIRLSFGPISTPSLYIYSEKGKLVKYFVGETSINDILKAL